MSRRWTTSVRVESYGTWGVSLRFHGTRRWRSGLRGWELGYHAQHRDELQGFDVRLIDQRVVEHDARRHIEERDEERHHAAHDRDIRAPAFERLGGAVRGLDDR